MAYVNSRTSCQLTSAVERNRTDFRQPVSVLFDTFSVDFAGPLPITDRGNSYVMVAVEHFSWWPIVRATQNQTSDVSIDFYVREIVGQFGIPQFVVSDNGPAFTSEVWG